MRFLGKHQQGKRAKWAESTKGYEHRKASNRLRLLAFVAEEVGFEPTVGCPTPHFEFSHHRGN